MKAKVAQGLIFTDEMNCIIDAVQSKLAMEMGKQLKEHQRYQELVQQFVVDQLAYALTRLCPKEILEEGFYQVLNLSVEAYWIAMGIEQTHLSNDQWAILLKEMRSKGKEVIPQTVGQGGRSKS
jgi:hypothetical protein